MDATLPLWNFIQREAQNMHLSPKKRCIIAAFGTQHDVEYE